MDLDVVLWRQLTVDLVPGHDRLHRRGALFDNQRIFLVECYPKPEDVSPAPRDVTVAQVHAEQIGIGGREAIEAMLAGPTPGA